MKRTDVEILSRDVVYQGYFRVDRYRLRHRTFEGGWTDPMSREIFQRGHAVAVLLYDPDRDSVVLIEQFRAGAHVAAESAPWPDAPLESWLIECVAGIVEPGEEAEQVARREVLEESGCHVLDLIPVCRYLASPGGSSETVALYCARVNAAEAQGIHGLAEEHENIRVFALPADKAFRWAQEGRVPNAAALIALQWLELNREAVRARWLGAT